MVRRLFFSAIIAGVTSGVLISAVHHVTTVPIIREAEVYEAAQNSRDAKRSGVIGAVLRFTQGNRPAVQVDPVHTDDRSSDGAPLPSGPEQIAYTVMTTILLGVGFAFLLISGMALRGEKPDTRRGVLWGAGGFIVFTLAPALGLPPEIPGLATADLVSRQIWWVATAVTTATGLWLLAFRDSPMWQLLAGVLMIVPHLVEVPGPHTLSASTAPAELAAQFAATSIVVAALFWTLLGGLSGYFFGRSAPAD